MISKFALLSNLLLASGALAVPSSRLGDHLARRDKIRQSQPLSRVASSAPSPPVVGTLNWAGVVLLDSSEIFSIVGGTFTIPDISTDTDGSAAIWVGIDGTSNCSQAILQTGIILTVIQNQVLYEAWYEWFPAFSMPFTGFDIHPGDVISAAVAADNATFGMAIIENQTTGQTVYTDLQGNSSTALCGRSAEWIVEDYPQDNVLVPLVNFSSVTFVDIYAMGPDAKNHTPSDTDANAYIFDIVQNNTVFTFVTIGNDSVTIQYIKGGF